MHFFSINRDILIVLLVRLGIIASLSGTFGSFAQVQEDTVCGTARVS